MKKNEEKGGFGLVLLLSLVGGTEKKKKKERGIRVFECFLSCREIKGIVL